MSLHIGPAYQGSKKTGTGKGETDRANTRYLSIRSTLDLL